MKFESANKVHCLTFFTGIFSFSLKMMDHVTVDDMMKNLNKMLSEMNGMIHRRIISLKLDIHEYKGINLTI